MRNRHIYIEEVKEKNFNAGFKARNDCDTILEACGYELLALPLPKPTFWNRLLRMLYIFRVAFSLRKAEKCFIQYPLYTYQKIPIFWHFAFKFFSGRLEILIHDIEGLRFANEIDSNLCYLLKRSDKIIVHTPRMKEIVKNTIKLNDSHMSVLYLFDYLTTENAQPANVSGNTIVFAGNLAKSAFLSKIDQLPLSVSFNLYGVYHNSIKEGPNCTYKGKFSPENISFIEGNWGLVWDGDQLETCHGKLGEYLRINSSHKISLYIAACKPVIVWKESSISNFIISNHLGIAVSSLYEIPERLADLSAEEKMEIENSVNRFSKKIKNGEMLKACI